MKKVISFILFLFSFCTFIMPTFARCECSSGESGNAKSINLLAGNTSGVGDKFTKSKRLVDNANLLSDSQKSDLLDKLDEVSERQQCDIVIVTNNSLNGKSSRDYADDYFDNNGYGLGSDKSGILLLVSMESRDWYVSTHGYGITAITDAGLNYISNKFLPSLKKGNYSDSFNTFTELCDKFITQAKTGTPYDSGNLPKEPLGFIFIPISLGVGFLIAFFITGLMKKQLKTVNAKTDAKDYVKEGSKNITNSKNIFLYSTVTKTKKPKESSGSSTHTSSSGETHGGGGGKF